MLRLLRIPREVQGFFEPVHRLFHKPQWRHFRFLVVALAMAWARHNWASVWRLVEGGPWRQKLNEFMVKAPWDGSKALMGLAVWLLKKLRPRRGETVYVPVDASHLVKRAKKMAGLGYFKDPATGRFEWGHQFLALGFWFRDLFLPAALAMYWPKKNVPAGRQFRTLNQLAAEMIRNLQVPPGVRIVVLFDAYFLNATVLDAVRERGWTWVSVASANRNLRVASGHRTKIGIYRRTCWRKGFRPVTFEAFGRAKRYRATEARTVWLSKVGKVQVVFCKAHRKQTPLALVSPSGSRRQLIEHYAQRWAIELFFKETKQLLGLGHYQTRAPQGVERHLQVVACAHLLLTHVRLIGATRAQAKTKRRALARVSTAEAQTRLRYHVLCDLAQIAMRRARSSRALERFMNLLLVA